MTNMPLTTALQSNTVTRVPFVASATNSKEYQQFCRQGKNGLYLVPYYSIDTGLNFATVSVAKLSDGHHIIMLEQSYNTPNATNQCIDVVTSARYLLMQNISLSKIYIFVETEGKTIQQLMPDPNTPCMFRIVDISQKLETLLLKIFAIDCKRAVNSIF